MAIAKQKAIEYTRRWVQCRVCRHAWFPRGDSLPVECPNLDCGSTLWNQPPRPAQVGPPQHYKGPPLHKCLRCLYEWFARKEKPKEEAKAPDRCPGCGSWYWNRERRLRGVKAAEPRTEPRKRA